MSYTSKVAWEVLRTLDTATMTNPALYYAVGTGLLFPSFKLKMVNNSNVLVTISIDGVSDHDVCPSGSFWLYDETQLPLPTAIPAVPAGTSISCKSASAGVGLIYLVSQYVVQQ